MKKYKIQTNDGKSIVIDYEWVHTNLSKWWHKQCVNLWSISKFKKSEGKGIFSGIPKKMKLIILVNIKVLSLKY